MATINTNTNIRKDVTALRTELHCNGVHMENIYVDGVKFCAVGYTNERDKAACIAAVEKAVKGSDGNLMEAMLKLQALANFGDNKVIPDEEMDVDGFPVILSYTNKAFYDRMGTTEITNARDMNCELPTEALKEILKLRAREVLKHEDEDEKTEDDSLLTTWVI